MAEAVAGFYAIETVAEGAVVAGIAASRPTVPLTASFKKLGVPESIPNAKSFRPSVHHSLNILKGKGYVFGGDTEDGSQDSRMKVITLPSSLEIGEVDFQVLEPQVAKERPLEAYSDSVQISTKGGFDGGDSSSTSHDHTANQIPEPRAAHASTTVDSNIFIISGRRSQAIDSTVSGESNQDIPLFDCDTIHCFSTQTNDWTTLHANISQCKDGIPEPRTNASCASTTPTKSTEAVDITVHAHGTIFLHGGYNAQGTMLRDTWAFSISSLTWSRWPDLPAPSAEEVAGEGRIIARGGSLCRVGDGFGKVLYLNYDTIQADVVTSTSGPCKQDVGVKPRTSTWETKTTTAEVLSDQPLAKTESLPMPRKNAGFVPVTTGSGRYYNLYFMGQDGPTSVLNDIWSYQVKPDGMTFASAKDAIRRVVGKGTGEDEWALCEVIESTMQEGPADLPGGLSGFAADGWRDLGGGSVVIWGGRKGDGTVVSGGWIMTVG